MSMRGWLLGLLLAGNGAWAATAADIPVKEFWRHTEFEQVRISPDGKHLAATVPDGDTRVLAVFTLSPFKMTGVAKFNDKRQLGAFTWVNKDRVAFTMSDQAGALVRPQPRGE